MALASYFFIPRFGWHSAFLIGALPLLYVPLVWQLIPESVPYLLARGRTVIRDASELRVKESDRVAVMVENLTSLGAHVTEQPDGMIIEGPTKVSPTKGIRSHGDHRVAMSMSILAIFADQPVAIANVACVDTSYPEFWEQLASLGVKVE